ncbi:MAG: uracil-DNA glycosylase [Oscillospiraceae bacterium]|jgi:DNA polymerase|nr:uracil-DNA glycosylase [Oscillospiraceae bacterium]
MQTLDVLNARFAAPLAATYALVPGEGDARAALMLIGEAPGAQEALQGRPFVGAAGKHLTAFLSGVGLHREELYITNAVKFRPTRPGKRGDVNRTPTKDEVALFRPWLLAEIETVRPRVVATLGNTALFAVTGAGLTIGAVHGRPLEAAGVGAEGVLFPLYHPASVIYRRELAAVYAADLRALRGFLAGLGEGGLRWGSAPDPAQGLRP